MKKYSLLLIISVFFLVACSPAKKTETSETTTTTTEQVEESSTEVSSTEEEKTESYQYQVESDGVTQTIKETIVYQGSKFHKIELHLTQETDEATKSKFAQYDFDYVKQELLAHLNEQNFMTELQAIEGVEVATDVTQEYTLIVNIKIDMQKADLAALSNVEGLGTDFTELAKITPAAYILGLRAHGAER